MLSTKLLDDWLVNEQKALRHLAQNIHKSPLKKDDTFQDDAPWQNLDSFN